MFPCHNDVIQDCYDGAAVRINMELNIVVLTFGDYMQSKLLFAALTATLPLAAFAQANVTLYGIADIAVAVEDTDAPGSSNRVVLNSGNQSSSRLGFRGTEDLGAGMKAMFNLEAGVNLDTGAADSALFGRRAVVGLEGSFGTLTLGREYTPIAGVAAASDIFGQGFYGSNLSAFTTNRLTRRLSNSVNFKTPSFGGLKASLVYGLGEQATGPSLDVIGFAADYSNGSLFLGAGYHVIERLASGDDKEYALGAGYKFGELDVKANYLVADQTGPNNKFEQLNLGASVGLGAGRIYANIQQNKVETGAKGKGFALAYSYPLSKRTNLYTSYAALRNNSTGAFGLNSSSTNVTPPVTALGSDPSVFTIGMRHSF